MRALYQDLLQLSLLLLSFSLLLVVVRNLSQQKKGIHLIIFCFGGFLSGLFFNDTFARNTSIISFSYPFLIASFYAIGPSLLLQTKSLTGRLTRLDLLHYVPVILVLFDITAHSLIHPDLYEENKLMIKEYRFSELQHSFMLEGARLFIGYTIITPLYGVISLFHSLKYSAPYKTGIRLLICTVLFLAPVLYDIVTLYTTGEKTLYLSADFERIALTLSTPVLLLHCVQYYRNRKEIALIPPAESSVQVDNVYESVNNQIIDFIEAELANERSALLEPGVTKDSFIPQTDFNKDEWELYFKTQGDKFSDLKKRVRIQRAMVLINEGYLKKYNIEGLSFQVGYRSRTSFYKAFEQITHQKLSEYRDRVN